MLKLGCLEEKYVTRGNQSENKGTPIVVSFPILGTALNFERAQNEKKRDQKSQMKCVGLLD